MPNKKTSVKQRESFEDMPMSKLKADLKPKKFKAAKRIRDKKYISKALWDSLQAGDVDAFKEILRTHLELTNKEEIARETGISRRSLYRMLSDEGNPTLENISRLVSKICT